MQIYYTILQTWEVSAPQQVEQKFRAILETEGDALSPTDRGQLLTQVARSLGLQDKFTDADILLEEAISIAQDQELKSIHAYDINTDVLRIRILLERGRVLRSSGHPADSLPLFQSATQKALALQPKASLDPAIQYLAVDALHMLAIVYPEQSERDASARKALEIAEGSDEVHTRGWVGPLINNLAWDAVDEGKFAEGLALFQRAEEARKEALDRTNQDASATDTAKLKAFTEWKISRWSVGHTQMLAGKKEEALQTFISLLKTPADGPAIRKDLATLHRDRGEKVAAVEHARKALELGCGGKNAQEMQKIIDENDQ